jgi:hypothetical protein
MVSRLGAPLCFLDTHPPLQRLFLLDLDYIGIALHHFSQAHFGGRASSPFTAYFRSSAGLAFLTFSVLQKKHQPERKHYYKSLGLYMELGQDT